MLKFLDFETVFVVRRYLILLPIKALDYNDEMTVLLQEVHFYQGTCVNSNNTQNRFPTIFAAASLL